MRIQLGRKHRPSICAVVLALAFATASEAQATRTWVSGVGDDANPCSRTAPCKTFAGAISKTDAGGEITVLDPGGYGAVTITKSITIAADGDLGSIIGAGTNGIVVSAGATDVVIIRGLQLNGWTTGLSGIKFLTGGALHVERSTIQGFKAGFGIEFVPTNPARLYVWDSVIRNNGDGNTGGGILVKPGVGGSATASLSTVRLEANVFGLRVEDSARATVVNSVSSGNGWAGFTARSASAEAVLTLMSCTSSGNGTVGLRADGALGIAYFSGTNIVNNPTGITTSAGGQLVSLGNNLASGNGADGAPTSTTSLK